MPPPERDRRRVLVILHESELGGASRAVLRCVPGLEERGWRFEFRVPATGSLAAHLRAEGRRVELAGRPFAYSLAALRLPPGAVARARETPAYVRAFRRLLADRPPGLVHANSHTTLLDAALAKRAGVPTVFHVHEMFGDSLKWELGRRLAFRSADRVIAVSNACADALSRGSRRPTVIHNGVALPERVAGRPDRGPGLIVGSVGVISRRKGTDLLVAAARLAREREPGLRFELVGAASEPLDARWAEAVLRDARAAGIEYRESADVAACLRRWDLFVLPSRRDPFPLSSLEAMAAAVPVVGTAVDGIAEQIGSAGILVAPESPERLADAIVDLARSPERRLALGEAARARVGREFTIATQVERIDAVYRSAVGLA